MTFNKDFSDRCCNDANIKKSNHKCLECLMLRVSNGPIICYNNVLVFSATFYPPTPWKKRSNCTENFSNNMFYGYLHHIKDKMRYLNFKVLQLHFLLLLHIYNDSSWNNFLTLKNIYWRLFSNIDVFLRQNLHTRTHSNVKFNSSLSV